MATKSDNRRHSVIFHLPKEFESMTADTMRTAIAGIDKELADLREEKMQLMRQRRMIETIMYIVYPDQAENDGYQGAGRVVAARLTRAKQLLEATGQTKDETLRLLAETVDVYRPEEDGQHQPQLPIKEVPRPAK